MAKGLRSSVKKSNRSKLRNRVFAPVEAARNQRLSAKLLELASQPRPTQEQKMDIDAEEASKAEEAEKDQQTEDMDIDGVAKPASKSAKSKSRKGGVTKNRRAKPRNTIAFPKYRGKGATKPFSQKGKR